MLYKQVNRVSVSSTFVPTWAYVFLIYFEMNCLLNCLSAFKPHYCWWYIDDVFAWVTLLQHLDAFKNFSNSQHANMSSAIENEKQTRLFVKMKTTVKLPLK